MRSFRDTKNREWKFHVTFLTGKTVKQQTGIDLFKLDDSEGSFSGAVSKDTFKLFDVILCLIESQLAEANVTVEDFAESLNEESVEQAAIAIQEAVFDFFPPQKAASFRRLLKQSVTKAQTKMDRAMEKLEKLLSEEEKPASGGSDGGSPESQDSKSGTTP